MAYQRQLYEQYKDYLVKVKLTVASLSYTEYLEKQLLLSTTKEVPSTIRLDYPPNTK